MTDRTSPIPESDAKGTSTIGVVVIGRNEGERLKRCLRSLVDSVTCMVYVDSGSTDGSGDFARSLGVEVIDLDMAQPFTMARGRNAGWQHLADQDCPVEFVQFIDGDCEVVDSWVETARTTLQERPDVVAVYGRRRERFPEASIYNGIADIEWDHPIGESKACGGDALMRLAAVQGVNGYRDSMIAGEEPEMCVRLRQNGWTILRIDAEMTLHDAAMMHFSQWWTRAARGGHAYAEGAALQGSSPQRHNVRPLKSIILWGFIVPLIALAGSAVALVTPWWWAGLIAVPCVALLYFVQTWRVYRYCHGRGYATRASWMYATSVMLGKFAQFVGVFTYWLNRLRNRQTKLMEYKTSDAESCSAQPSADRT